MRLSSAKITLKVVWKPLILRQKCDDNAPLVVPPYVNLTRSLREPGGPWTKSMEVSESRMERVKLKSMMMNEVVGVFIYIGFAEYSPPPQQQQQQQQNNID